jgi:hypothetical protein
LITFDGINYTRRVSPDYDAWRANGFDANSPFALYSGTKKDSVNPQLTVVPMGNPSIQADPTLLPGSPGIDAGDPVTFVLEGGGSRVDIGVAEALLAPYVAGSDPGAGETCGVLPAGVPMTVTLADVQGDLDAGSIVAQVNGMPTAASVAGGGASAVVSVPLPATLPVTNVVTLELTAADTAGPPHVSTIRLCFTAAPPVPVNVHLP